VVLLPSHQVYYLGQLTCALPTSPRVPRGQLTPAVQRGCGKLPAPVFSCLQA